MAVITSMTNGWIIHTPLHVAIVRLQERYTRRFGKTVDQTSVTQRWGWRRNYHIVRARLGFEVR
jgi:hypothetical protein